MKTITTLILLLFCMISVAQDKIYVHTATAANTSGHVTTIDHPDLNGKPNAGIVFTHSWNPNGLPAVYNNNVTALWYDGANWTIYNEDTSNSMVEGSHYMVYIADNPSSVITHVSTAANQGILPHITLIDNPSMNNANPGPYAVMSHYYNPNGIYNPEVHGFYYDETDNKRAIYQEAGVTIPTGAAFKILVQGQGVTRFTHTTTSGNSSGHTTIIDNAALNGNPNATFVFSHYYGAIGASSENEINAIVSAYYGGGFWRLYCEDQSTPMDEGLAFDIIVAPQDVLSVNDNQLVTTITMFPNPSKTNVYFKASEIIETITIFNMLGQQVMNVNESANDVQIDVSSLETGAYLAKVKTVEGTQTLQLIKE